MKHLLCSSPGYVHVSGINLLRRQHSPWHSGYQTSFHNRNFNVTTSWRSPKRRRAQPTIMMSSDQQQDMPAERFEQVEDGVTLPEVESAESLEAEGKWLEKILTDWLDQEWEQGEAQPIHAEIGELTARIYKRQRMEGENDLSSVLLAIGSELEGMDFSAAFIGPWNVANKAAELLIEHRAGPRIKLKPFLTPPDAPKWSIEMESNRSNNERYTAQQSETRRPYAPHLADYFEKLNFLREVLDKEAPAEVVDGAVALAAGYRYDTNRKLWNGDEVEDEHFRKFGDVPPDVLGDENAADFTDTLKHLEDQLGLDEDETGDKAKGLEMVIETLHGKELMDVQLADPNDHSFRKRVVVAKWLHLRGGF